MSTAALQPLGGPVVCDQATQKDRHRVFHYGARTSPSTGELPHNAPALRLHSSLAHGRGAAQKVLGRAALHESVSQGIDARPSAGPRKQTISPMRRGHPGIALVLPSLSKPPDGAFADEAARSDHRVRSVRLAYLGSQGAKQRPIRLTIEREVCNSSLKKSGIKRDK